MSDLRGAKVRGGSSVAGPRLRCGGEATGRRRGGADYRATTTGAQQETKDAEQRSGGKCRSPNLMVRKVGEVGGGQRQGSGHWLRSEVGPEHAEQCVVGRRLVRAEGERKVAKVRSG
jgi:hypothetical protein